MAGSHSRLVFLKASADIERVKRSGRRLQTPLFNLVSFTSDVPSSRVGVIVGRRLGGAVVRNRAKRIFRELARGVAGRLIGGRDMLVFPRREALSASHATLSREWLSALNRERLLED